jgi:uncharacterized membrane protein
MMEHWTVRAFSTSIQGLHEYHGEVLPQIPNNPLLLTARKHIVLEGIYQLLFGALPEGV